jgi:hypothetical protein
MPKHQADVIKRDAVPEHLRRGGVAQHVRPRSGDVYACPLKCPRDDRGHRVA